MIIKVLITIWMFLFTCLITIDNTPVCNTLISTNESLKRCFLFLTAFILTELVVMFLWGKEIESFLNGF